jgi:hypothetical protein
MPSTYQTRSRVGVLLQPVPAYPIPALTEGVVTIDEEELFLSPE